MEMNLHKVKNETRTFLIANFTITFFMGILMFFLYKGNEEIAAQFAGAQMLYPALVAIAGKVYYEKENIPKKLMNFFKFYIISCALFVIILVVGVFLFPTYISIVLGIFTGIISISAFIQIDSCFERISMIFTKNFKTVVSIALVFIAIKFTIILASGIFDGSLHELLRKAILRVPLFIFSIIIALPLGFIPFFGEELGWRQYLQPRLQILFGKKIGVIILGFIWGIWHLPLCFMLYSPSTPVYCVINHIFFCMSIGVFFGFAYMRTGNLWSVIILHLINNVDIFNTSGAYGGVITTKDLILNLLVCAVMFLPFIFTKEYKSQPDRKECEELKF